MSIANGEGVKLEEADTDNLPISSSSPANFSGRIDLSSYAFTPASLIKNEALSSSKPASPHRHSIQTPSPGTTPHQRAPATKTPSLKRSSSTTPLPSPSKKPKRPKPTGYAPPSTYAHLPELTDILAPSLHLLFIGLNPGLTTASQGHAYAHPSNRFWSLVHSSGITTRRLRPEEDGTLLDWGCGNTNIVARPTRNGGELGRGEMDGNVGVLVGKVAKWRPEAVCVVGKGIWESIFRVLKGRSLKKDEFAYGWQEGERLGVEEDGIDVENGEAINGWEGARVFVACSTSGLAASVPFAEKERIWRELGVWIEGRRSETGISEVKANISEPSLKNKDP